MDNNPQAARQFYQSVRALCEGATAITEGVVFHQVTPDEQFDMSRLSYRLYGRWDEFLAVMAAAGLDTSDAMIPQGRLAFPTEAKLLELKRAAGFESQPRFRSGGQPTWKTD